MDRTAYIILTILGIVCLYWLIKFVRKVIAAPKGERMRIIFESLAQGIIDAIGVIITEL